MCQNWVGLCIAFRFIEGDFDAYITRIQEPYVWGGEPELIMASHVLKWVLDDLLFWYFSTFSCKFFLLSVVPMYM